MNIPPSISVIMPVFNAESSVEDSIKSILNQSFENFELIIINDCSNDLSLEIIKSFTDKRIRLIRNRSNIGDYPSRNIGHRLAIGKYICEMDTNIMSLPHRLERQFKFMEENLNVGIAGCGYKFIGRKREFYGELYSESLKINLLKDICMIHPSLIIRRELLQKHKVRYNKDFVYAADYDLLANMSRFSYLTNIPEVLIEFYNQNNQSSAINRKEQENFADMVRISQLSNFRVEFSKEKVDIFLSFVKQTQFDIEDTPLVYDLIETLLCANKKIKYYNQSQLEDFFDYLILNQTFLLQNKNRNKNNFKSQNLKKNIRFDASDTTFIIPIRIESDARYKNLEIIISFIKQYFDTKIILLEADKKQRYTDPLEKDNIKYIFQYDENPIFHRTCYINQMLKLAETPYVAVWDTDAIVYPTQVIEALQKLRSKQAIMAFPYDGRFYLADQYSSTLFHQTRDYKIFYSNYRIMKLMHGYHVVGGAYFVDRKKYIAAGMENESFLSWGLEDNERVKRMEVMGYSIFRASGPMFHLYHPRGKNSDFASQSTKINNYKVYLKTCGTSKENLD